MTSAPIRDQLADKRGLDGQDDQDLRGPGCALDRQCRIRPGRADASRTRRPTGRGQAAGPDHRQFLGGSRIRPGCPRNRPPEAHHLRAVDRSLHGLYRTGRAARSGQPIGWVSLACELQRDWARIETVPAIVDIVLTDRLTKE